MSKKLHIYGIPENEEHRNANAFLKSVILKKINDYVAETKVEELALAIYMAEDSAVESGSLPEQLSAFLNYNKTEQLQQSGQNNPENDYETRALQYKGEQPFHSFEQLILNEEILAEIHRALSLFSKHDLMYIEWGLREIDPFPVVALNFYGPSGTGKTLAAHAIADYLHKNIIIASYAQIESMYHGEGPKNVESIFLAAQRDNAVLFIDEADSLLSRRLTNVTQGSEQAINSMRSQLLICLEKFKGIVIFATNLAENYDKAFETRIRSIHFTMPDASCRKRIWERHIPKTFPIEEGLDRNSLTDELAQIDDFCGRDIKNAVKSVAEELAVTGNSHAGLKDFQDAVERVKARRLQEENNAKELPLDDEQKSLLTEIIQNSTENLETKDSQENCVEVVTPEILENCIEKEPEK